MQIWRQPFLLVACKLLARLQDCWPARLCEAHEVQLRMCLVFPMHWIRRYYMAPEMLKL